MATQEEIEQLIAVMREFKPNTILLQGEPTDKYSTVFESIAKPGMGCCDFCSGPGPFVTFETEPFTIDTGTPFDFGDADGMWAACQECTGHILTDDLPGLIDRAVTTALLNHPALRTSRHRVEIARANVTRLHTAFWENKKWPK